jgi:hypothetical protein
LPDVPRALDTPPMLRASWDLAVTASLEDPNSFPESGSVAEIAERIAPTGAWLVWRREPSEEGMSASSGGVSSALAQSLEDYVAARARLEAARFSICRGLGAVPAKPSGTVAQTGTVSSVDQEKPFPINRMRSRPCQTVPSLETGVVSSAFSTPVAPD